VDLAVPGGLSGHTGVYISESLIGSGGLYG
jgi:hypothetical protein